MSFQKFLVLVMMCAVLCQVAKASEYIVDLPQLVGSHGTAPYTVVDVNQQLRTAFSQIVSGSVRLSGEQFPGTITNFFSYVQGPVGATLQLEDPSAEIPFTPFPYFEYRLPDDVHEFSLDIPIGVAYQAIPDFKQWLDGTAEFTFSVGPPPTSGSYVTNPIVRIDRAQLVLIGEPLGVPEPGAAFVGTSAIMFFIGLLRFRRCHC